MLHAPTFGDLRVLLHAPPDEALWRELIGLLDAWDGPEPLAEVVVPYCAARLARWPLHLERPAPEAWGRRLFTLGAQPHLLLATSLELHDFEIRDAWARRAARSGHLAGLRALSLTRNHLGDLGAAALAEFAPLPRLERLVLPSNRIGHKGAQMLADAGLLAGLRALSLRGNLLRARGARVVARADGLDLLQDLDLSENGIDASALKTLMERLPALHMLQLNDNPLRDVGAFELAERLRGGAHRLEELELVGCSIGDEGATALLDAQQVARLRKLTLWANPLSLEMRLSLQSTLAHG